MIRLLLSLLLVNLLFSCKPASKEVSLILPPKKMQVVLWDFILIDTYEAEIA
jgi:hypothetical protein